MKILKYIIVILIIIAIAFFALGFLTPSISYSSEITVDKPIKEAWAVMNDESKISEWLKGITKKEHISGEKGKVGAVTEYTYTDNGNEGKILETLKEIKPYEYIAMHFEMKDVMEMEYQMNFTEKDGKTHIKSSSTNTGKGMFMRSMISLSKSTVQGQEDENLSNLKKVIEENTTNYFLIPVEKKVEVVN